MEQARECSPPIRIRQPSRPRHRFGPAGRSRNVRSRTRCSQPLGRNAERELSRHSVLPAGWFRDDRVRPVALRPRLRIKRGCDLLRAGSLTPALKSSAIVGPALVLDTGPRQVMQRDLPPTYWRKEKGNSSGKDPPPEFALAQKRLHQLERCNPERRPRRSGTLRSGSKAFTPTPNWRRRRHPVTGG